MKIRGASPTENKELQRSLVVSTVNEMMSGTGAKDLTREQKPFEQEQPADNSGG